MASIVNRLKDFIRGWFTREVVSFEMPQASTQDTTRKKIRKRYHSVAPSERFVWGIIVVFVALFSLIALEVVYIVVTKTFSSELFGGISGLVTYLVTIFATGKRGRRND